MKHDSCESQARPYLVLKSGALYALIDQTMLFSLLPYRWDLPLEQFLPYQTTETGLTAWQTARPGMACMAQSSGTMQDDTKPGSRILSIVQSSYVHISMPQHDQTAICHPRHVSAPATLTTTSHRHSSKTNYAHRFFDATINTLLGVSGRLGQSVDGKEKLRCVMMHRKNKVWSHTR